LVFGVFHLLKEFLSDMFWRKKTNQNLTLETLVEMDLITKAEMLLLKKERAVKEWEEEIKPKLKRGKKL
jgi:hypothetical protein